MSYSSHHSASLRDDSPCSDDAPTRKRVGKACDRCRLKKSKCDGSNPCSRCTLDDQICTFTERKRSKEKTYPKGYVELLETRVDMLTEGLQELARRAAGLDAQALGMSMPLNGQRPSINKLLEDLGALQTESSGLSINLYNGENEYSSSPQSTGSLHSPSMKYEAQTPPEMTYGQETISPAAMSPKSGFQSKGFMGLGSDQILFDSLEDAPASFAQAWNPTALEDLHSYQANMAFLNGSGFVSPFREEIDWTLA